MIPFVIDFREESTSFHVQMVECGDRQLGGYIWEEDLSLPIVFFGEFEARKVHFRNECSRWHCHPARNS
jgi:hypothetical protein